jgi:hypothetical protein
MTRKKNTKSIVDENVPMILPSDNEIMKAYIQKNKIQLTEKTLSSIEYAVNNKLPFVEIFGFKNSDFIIAVSENDYLENVNNIYSFYLETENYELCSRIVKLKTLLNNNTNEKEIEINKESK